MSAYVVTKAHIDYLVQAGLDLPKKVDPHSKLRWFEPEPELSTDRQRGSPRGPTIAQARARERVLTGRTADRVGEMLWAENERSVHHCYDGRDDEPRLAYKFERRKVFVGYVWRIDPTQGGRILPEPGDEGWRYSRTTLDAMNVLHALACYDYQSCEHREWETSEAHAFCEALHKLAIEVVIEALPGYHDGPWAVYGLEDMTGKEDATRATAPRFI